MTSDVNEFNLPDMISQFMEKIDGFSGQINYVRVC